MGPRWLRRFCTLSVEKLSRHVARLRQWGRHQTDWVESVSFLKWVSQSCDDAVNMILVLNQLYPIVDLDHLKHMLKITENYDCNGGERFVHLGSVCRYCCSSRGKKKGNRLFFFIPMSIFVCRTAGLVKQKGFLLPLQFFPSPP